MKSLIISDTTVSPLFKEEKTYQQQKNIQSIKAVKIEVIKSIWVSLFISTDNDLNVLS